uniref:Uncharacterized protein n=1 Tax=Rhizophora mucronata TaxID=61149 RepID=A0A2P2PF53_RHIMU
MVMQPQMACKQIKSQEFYSLHQHFLLDDLEI